MLILEKSTRGNKKWNHTYYTCMFYLKKIDTGDAGNAWAFCLKQKNLYCPGEKYVTQIYLLRKKLFFSDPLRYWFNTLYCIYSFLHITSFLTVFKFVLASLRKESYHTLRIKFCHIKDRVEHYIYIYSHVTYFRTFIWKDRCSISPDASARGSSKQTGQLYTFFPNAKLKSVKDYQAWTRIRDLRLSMPMI